MKSLGSKITAIFILSLFLLGKTPIANLSKNIRGTALSPFSTSVSRISDREEEPGVSTIVTPDKHSLVDLSFRSFSSANVISMMPAASYNGASTVAMDNFISISGVNAPLFTAVPVNNSLPDAGNGVGIYNNKFFYGHNISNVFAGLHNLSIGSIFSVTRNGVTTNYQVRVSEILTKDSLSQSTPESKNTLWQIYNAKYRGNFDIALMTCAGVNYTGGDASHRLVIMATRV